MPPPPTQEMLDAAADEIRTVMERATPFCIGRNGSTELELLRAWVATGRHFAPVHQPLFDRLQRYSGIWPATAPSVQRWAEATLDALGTLDVVAAGWYDPAAAAEDALLREAAPTAVRVPLRALEPYYVGPDRRWTRHLAGKRVAIVTSFTDTIGLQLDTHADPAAAIWSSVAEPETLLPPTTSWSLVRTGQPPVISLDEPAGSWPPIVRSWEDAVEYVVEETLSHKPDVALIGCGALGLLIAARLKRAGVSCVVMGGAIQVLFGVKGRRWEDHPVISRFWNEGWIWPVPTDVPRGAYLVEGGCYWGAPPASKPSSTPR